MNEETLKKVNNDFSEEKREEVLKLLNSISLKHVMAESEYNLNSTINSALKLANGNLIDLIKYIECAKQDFRDVIYWATLEDKT